MRKWVGILAISLTSTVWPGFAQAADAPSPRESWVAFGEEMYGQNCAHCHYEGKGNIAAPDLVGSPFWKESPEKTILLILRGQSGASVVNGKKFGGEMPPMAYMTDEEIAGVTTYLFAKFAEKQIVVDPSTVKELRSAK